MATQFLEFRAGKRAGPTALLPRKDVHGAYTCGCHMSGLEQSFLRALTFDFLLFPLHSSDPVLQFRIDFI